MKAALDAYVERINAGDVEGILALFAPDAVIEDPVGTEAKTGAAIRAWFADTVAFETRIHPLGPPRGSQGREAALAFDVEFTPPDSPRLRIRSIDVCSFDAQNRITYLRGYWGPDDIGPAHSRA
ncbi:nuclear transport factor 2 family protein [Novosphingobium sp. PhB165]|uniref:nuclear transport factor 2 family protein n=1 Tax=Novosphingobium sp. PhB165 TaxID=2485105 RepID=UPI00104C8AF9|nr:nuclear transport factor 2 family protein [Novosphingobium sp. PhB165]